MSPFDIQRMLIDEFPLSFLLEVGFRATFAFLAVFLFLKSSGRRGIRQLSLFELVVILTLGSAAGDVSFYHDVPLLPVAVVFLTLLLLYRMTVLVMTKSKKFEAWIDGLPVTVIRNGLYEPESLEKLNISSSEILMELRQRGVEHLGQVRLALMETDGDISLYFFRSRRRSTRYVSPTFRASCGVHKSTRHWTLLLRELWLCTIYSGRATGTLLAVRS